ncbi:receptor for retinol uptake stra6-like [Mercenaria mercenaria]|uniref:receptor for retinol uptake stra6-like n=1 Tax=Mercenaria mercenaria TaxID=6596 RepID=UPI00234F931E|nr:receptor for retinol uptake stra6-like [Mercenaria mercenaria]XP_045199275.2 receptor for retinol uptake stra6-like [Mercenaria mercenaria]
MAEFLSALNGFYQNIGSGDDNDTQSESTECKSKIPTQAFHFYLTMPSVAMMLLLACTISRKNRWLSCLWGRPGAVFPMDILGKSHRFSYAAAWGSIAFLAADLVFGSTVIIKLEGPSYVTVFNTVLSMIVIGVDYFPMFAALSLESVIGYMVGTAYAWLLLGIQIFREIECDLVIETRLILILRDLPNLLCLTYLSISLPIRLIQSLRKKSIRIISSSEMVSILNMDKEADLSPEAIHVKRLLRPVPPPPPPPSTLGGKLMGIVKAFVSDWIYHNTPKFRYSARVLSVMLIGVMLIYKVTLEVMTLVISILALVERGLQLTLNVIGWVAEPGEESHISEIRDYTYLMYYLLENGRICFIVALSLACVGGILGILHMLSSYRTNLFDLYKGDNTHIPHRSTRSNASLLVGSMRYAGYQVAYIGWGLVLHFIILLVIALALCVLITLIINGYYKWLLTVLMNAWPAVLMTIIILMTQTLLSKFAFLQGRGEFLAINNRRVLFSFTFFMFFYNIFVGFLSCLLRIIKSIVIGAIFLPRLDNSALPRRFQMFDPGFANYCGFIHVECAHTHPVLVMFLRILLIFNEENKSKKSVDENHTAVDINGKEKIPLKSKPVNPRARARWFLIYTLQSNPSLRVYRKSYIQYMKMWQERLARHYKIDKSTMGNLVGAMNNAFVNDGKADIDDISVEVSNGGVNAAQANWNALFGMSKLLQQIQRDMAERKGAFSEEADRQAEMQEAGNTDTGTNVFVKTPKNMWKRAAHSALTTKTNVPSTDL